MESKSAQIIHNVAAMHAAPDGGSEQVSQAINGDHVLCLEAENDYLRVRATDGYEGWVWQGNVGQVTGVQALGIGGPQITSGAPVSGVAQSSPSSPFEIPWPFWADLPDHETTPEVRYVSADIVNLYAVPNEPRSLITKLVVGTWLRVLNAPTANLAPFIYVAIPFHAISGYSNLSGSSPAPQPATTNHQTPDTHSPLLLSGYLKIADTRLASGHGYQDEFSGEAVCALAQRFIGTPYLWGGTTPFGFDCSGYVQRLYALHNVMLPRDAYLQARSPLGVGLTPLQAPAAGDLVFFCGRSDPRKRGITHVGIALDAERFIHAYGKQGVIVTRFDDPVYRSAYSFVRAWRCRSSKIE